MSADEKLPYQHILNSWRMLCNNTLNCIISIFLIVKNKRSVIFGSSQNKRKQTTSIFRTKEKFCYLFLLPAAKSSLLHWTDNQDFYWLLWAQHWQSGQAHVWRSRDQSTRAVCVCVVEWSVRTCCLTPADSAMPAISATTTSTVNTEYWTQHTHTHT